MPRYGYLLPTRGVVLSSEGRGAALAARTRADVVGLAKRAESMGFDSVWVGDSVLAKPRLESLTTLAAVATATDAVELGTAVYLPVLRNPVHVAHQTATVDQLSGGRLTLGVGVGLGDDVEAEHRALDVPYAERGHRMDELLDILTALWSGESIDYDGQFYHLESASIGFEPVRKPKIAISTAAFDPDGDVPRPIVDRLVEFGDSWLPIGVSPATYADSLATMCDSLEGAGRDPTGVTPAIYLDVVFDEDRDRAIETARRFYERYYPDWGTLSDEEVEAFGAFGPPDTIVDALDEYTDAGVENVVLRLASNDQRAQLRQLADVTVAR